eukprot:SAG11_NODE_9214_length_926_cov_1.403361_1_plen_52_part_10
MLVSQCQLAEPILRNVVRLKTYGPIISCGSSKHMGRLRAAAGAPAKRVGGGV